MNEQALADILKALDLLARAVQELAADRPKSAESLAAQAQSSVRRAKHLQDEP